MSGYQAAALEKSPSSRRAWIEMRGAKFQRHLGQVALLAEGVDRNKIVNVYTGVTLASPSSRRAWIEIAVVNCLIPTAKGRPPRGGRG